MPHISFEKLQESHFPLLLAWLMTPHVRAWWDKEIAWTPEVIAEKYGEYVYGYKQITAQERKPIHPYIILLGNRPVGYIQYYRKSDFPSDHAYSMSMPDFPEDTAAIDWYIGEADILRKGIGTAALTRFVEQYVLQAFDAVCVDPDAGNIAGIRTYEKAGFLPVKKTTEAVWLLKKKKQL